jgi:uncharacterized protein YcnI
MNLLDGTFETNETGTTTGDDQYDGTAIVAGTKTNCDAGTVMMFDDGTESTADDGT